MNKDPLEKIIDDVGLTKFAKCEYMVNCHQSDFGTNCNYELKEDCKIYQYLKKFEWRKSTDWKLTMKHIRDCKGDY